MKDAKKEEEFQKWVFNLDKKFLNWSWRSPGDLDGYITINNTKGYDRTFQRLSTVCSAPDCHYPLRNDGGQDRLPMLGDVCNLCYFMYHLLNGKAYWVAIQQQENERKNKRDDRR